MKRSEVLRFLEKDLDQILVDVDAFNSAQIAQMILDNLEKNHGMQPPAIKEPCESFVLHNGQYLKVEDSFIFTSKWEQE